MPRQLSWADYGALVKEGGAHTLVDVRERHEYESGHIGGSRNIPLSELTAAASSLPHDPSTLLITCCRSGSRAAYAAQMLANAGYRNTAFIAGDAGARYQP